MKIGFKVLLVIGYVAILTDIYFMSRVIHGVILVSFVLSAAICGAIDHENKT